MDSQPVGTIELAEIAVERSEWPVAGLASHLQHQAVRKAHRRTLPKALDGGGDGVAIGDEGLGGRHLPGVIPGDKPDEHVCVNGSHDAS